MIIISLGVIGFMNLYYPHLEEFISLTCFVLFLLLIGKVIKYILLQRKELSKFPLIFFVWIMVITLYVLFSGYLYLNAEPSHRLIVLGWSLLFWFIPMFYYSFFFVNVVTSQIVEQISPIGDKIEDPSPFANARKLALMGDIDGAIALYRSYKNNQVEALFEIFRLLKSKERHEEAFQTLQEIIENYEDRTSAWIEAKYYQAKIKSAIFKKYNEAIQLYKQILRKRPKTPFHTIASAEIARLQAICKTDSSSADNSDITNTSTKKEAGQNLDDSHVQHFSKEQKKRYILAVEDTLLGSYVPPDPFFKGDIKKVMKDMEESAKEPKRKKTTSEIGKKTSNKNTRKEETVKKQNTKKQTKPKEQKKKKS